MRMVVFNNSVAILRTGILLLALSIAACQSDSSNPATTLSATETQLELDSIAPVWCFALQSPDGNWSLRLQSVFLNQDGSYTALAHLWRKTGSGIQVISELTMCAPLNLAGKKIEIYITGKRWGWKNQTKASFVKIWPANSNSAKLVYEYNENLAPIIPTPAGNPDR